MNSTTSMIAEEYRIQQWVAGIQTCQMRPKDIYVAAWCHEHGIWWLIVSLLNWNLSLYNTKRIAIWVM